MAVIEALQLQSKKTQKNRSTLEQDTRFRTFLDNMKYMQTSPYQYITWGETS